MSQEMAQLRWLCRRGTKELDVLLNRYLEQHYASANPQEKQAFQQLLSLEDPILSALLLESIKPDSEHIHINVAQKALLKKLCQR